MTFALFVGCFLVSCGPLFAIFCTLIAKNDQMVILTFLSSFFWLLGIIVSAVLWAIVPYMPLSIVIAVGVQEGFRGLFYLLYVKSERVMRPRTGPVNGVSNRMLAAMAGGVGSGLMYSLLMFTSLLWDATGPATLFSRACPGTNLFVLNALHALAFGVMHIAWSIVAFDAYRQIDSVRGKGQIGAVAASHLVASLLTLLNGEGGSCVMALIGVYTVTVGTVVGTWLLVKKTYLIET